MPEMPTLTLYQAEWCPFSSAVREILTELGIDVVLRQVEAWPEERAMQRQVARTDQIPVLQDENGTFHRGTCEIFAYLGERDMSQRSFAHRRRFTEHRDARKTVSAELIERFRKTPALTTTEAASSAPSQLGTCASK